MEIDRREQAPWKPQRGEFIRLPGTTLAIPEWAGFTVVLAIVVALLILALTVWLENSNPGWVMATGVIGRYRAVVWPTFWGSAA